MEDIYHIGIHEPDDIRRTLLESSRNVIFSLQRFEKLKLLRVEKTTKMVDLNNQIDELVKLIGFLKKELPKIKTKTVSDADKVPDVIEPLKMPKFKKIDKFQTMSNINDLDRLENELLEVEERLNKLT